MSCVIPANQPIYQALLDKAASYPADKPDQIKAYKKAAESVLSYNRNFYDSSIIEPIPGIGKKIEEFIDDFVAKTARVNKITLQAGNWGHHASYSDKRKRKSNVTKPVERVKMWFSTLKKTAALLFPTKK